MAIDHNFISKLFKLFERKRFESFKEWKFAEGEKCSATEVY